MRLLSVLNLLWINLILNSEDSRGLELDVANSWTTLGDTDSSKSMVTPSWSPRVLDQPVFETSVVVNSVSNYRYCTVEWLIVTTTLLSCDDTRLIKLEPFGGS